MGRFWTQNQGFFVVFSESVHWLAIKKWVKVTLWSFKWSSYFVQSGTFLTQKCKGTKIHKICSLDFRNFLWWQTQVKWFLKFFRTTWIMPKELHIHIVHISNFLFHCFIFPNSFSFKARVHCYFPVVCYVWDHPLI